MPTCPVCKKWCESLGIMRHMQMHADDRGSPGYRHNGKIRNKRHRCGVCGRTRKECYMSPIGWQTRWGNQVWVCADSKNTDCNSKELKTNQLTKIKYV